MTTDLVVCMGQLCQMFGPLFFILILKLSYHVPQGLVCSLHLSIPWRVVRCCRSLTYSKLSTQLGYDLTGKTLTLVSYDLLWGTKYGDEPLIETLCNCGCLLVSSDVCPHISSEVIHYHKDILDLWCLVQIHGRFKQCEINPGALVEGGQSLSERP